jgi:hypothetical protein
MEVGTMSFSEGYGKEYGELLEYDSGEASLIFGESGVLRSSISSNRRTSGGRNSSSSSNGPLNSPQQMIERFSRTRGLSEMSMDLSDLQDVLGEEDSSSRSAQGSMLSSSSLSESAASPFHQQKEQQSLNPLLSVQEDDDSDNDDEDDSFTNSGEKYNSNNSRIEFDEIPEGSFQLDESPIKSPNANRRGSLLSVDEEGESDWPFSADSLAGLQGSASHNLYQSNNSRRKVKFEISTRLEDIQEFEKPDVEDNHMLYYSAHELQKMMDSHREEERRERHTVR